MTSSITSFLLYLILQRKQSVEEKARLQSFIEVPNFLKVFYWAISCLTGPLAVIVFVFVAFPQVSEHVVTINLVVIIFLVLVSSITVYWIRINKIVRFFLSEFGYRGLLRMRRYVVFSMFFMIIFFVVFFFSWTIPDPTLRFSYGGLSLWIMFPCAVFYVLSSPFLEPPLSIRGSAILCLQEFLSDYESNQENADFGYIREASKNIRSILKSYNFPISPNVLSEYISCEHLNYRRATTQRIMESLEPFNEKKLIDIVKRIPNIKGKGERELTFDRVLKYLHYLVVIAASIMTAIAYLVRL